MKSLTENYLAHPHYDPNAMIDALVRILRLKNDATLARRLHVSPSVISKVRHRQVSIGPSLLVRMHEVTGIGIDRLRSLAGVGRPWVWEE